MTAANHPSTAADTFPEGFERSTWEEIALYRESLSPESDPAAFGPEIPCGFPEDRTDVDPCYLVTIRSAALGKRVVRALLQDDFSTAVKSTWAEPTLTSLLTRKMQETTQLLTGGYALGSQFMTRRIWYGSSPMNLHIKLKFESIYDAHREVVLACGSLQQLALPSKVRFSGQDKNLGQRIGESVLIVPPGPNAFYLSGSGKEGASDTANPFAQREGDRIEIRIGNLMEFRSVIVRDVEVTWGRRFTKEGNPINATATIHFESFEIYTKEDINDEVFRKGQPTLEQLSQSDLYSQHMDHEF